jgi:hypothetical protein
MGRRRNTANTPVKAGTFGLVKATRYPELSYQHRIDHWRLIADSGWGMGGIGPQYATEAELLADLDRMADVYGC